MNRTGRAVAARAFVFEYRRKRAQDERDHPHYRSAPPLAIWVAWEHARDDLARSIADDVAAGREVWPEGAEAYRIARDRILHSAQRCSRRHASAKAS